MEVSLSRAERANTSCQEQQRMRSKASSFSFAGFGCQECEPRPSKRGPGSVERAGDLDERGGPIRGQEGIVRDEEVGLFDSADFFCMKM